MYAAIPDPYCYPGTTVLKNVPGLRDADALEAYEVALSRERASQPLPAGRLSVSHYQAIHRHLFQDVYPWAGRFRTVRIAKGGSMFCYPEHISSEMRRLFAELRARAVLKDDSPLGFAAGAAHFLSELNAIHPFREGNGRTQLAFLSLLAVQAGHPLQIERLNPETFLAAVVKSFTGNEAALVNVIADLVS